MADCMTKEQRSRNMSHIKSKDTSIELKVRKYLYHHGFRYRKNVKTLPGKPDIVLLKYRNVENDLKHYKELEQMDYKVIVVWECELKECFEYRMKELIEEIIINNRI